MVFFKDLMEVSFYNSTNNFCLIVVTMTTVGFGDYVPYTTLGKTVALITVLWGTFIISLLIVSVKDLFTLTPKQFTAWE